MRALKPTEVIEIIESDGPEAALSFLTGSVKNEKVAEVVKRLYLEVGLTQARVQQRERAIEVRKGFGLNERWIAFIEQYLNKFALELLTFEVAQTQRDRMVKLIQEGVEQGLGRREIGKMLQNEDLTKGQAARIARTEVNRASNVGHQAQASTLPYRQVKEWISARDTRVRGRDKDDHASHWDLNGVTVDENEFFIDPRNKDRLMFPGDPKASAESTINCRCRVLYKPKRDANGKLIPR
jgi:hypothetical protein